MIELFLYSRSYCHLCDDMQTALQAYRDENLFDLQVVDVDAEPALVALYDEMVPVLMARTPDGAMRRLCHYFLDHAALLLYFADEKARNRGSPASAPSASAQS